MTPEQDPRAVHDQLLWNEELVLHLREAPLDYTVKIGEGVFRVYRLAFPLYGPATDVPPIKESHRRHLKAKLQEFLDVHDKPEDNPEC
jgi:hypothetical protein